MKHLVVQDNSTVKDSRQFQQHQRIVQFLSKSETPLTAHELSKELQVSVPTGLKLINDLLDEDVIVVEGKKKTGSGRKPSLYKLNNLGLFVLSVEILLKRVTVGIIDLNLGAKYYKQYKDFQLEDSQECLEQVISIIEESILNSGVSQDKLIGMGVGITGRVNMETGTSLNYFTFLPESLSSFLKSKFSLPVIINNDTRCYGLAENFIGKAKSRENAIVINLSRGLGTSLIINNTIINGGHGYAGEFGHMQFGDSDKMCMCGKRGCLGNEVSGFALEEMFKEALRNGELSMLSEKQKSDSIIYDDILDAAINGDGLSIQLIQDLGTKLGKALGNIVNLLNPELIIIGGKFAKLNDILGDSIKAGMTKTSLVSPLSDCEIEFSELGDLAGLKGAGLLVYEHYELI